MKNSIILQSLSKEKNPCGTLMKIKKIQNQIINLLLMDCCNLG